MYFKNIFSQFCGLSFYFLYSVFWWTHVLNFNLVKVNNLFFMSFIFYIMFSGKSISSPEVIKIFPHSFFWSFKFYSPQILSYLKLILYMLWSRLKFSFSLWFTSCPSKICWTVYSLFVDLQHQLCSIWSGVRPHAGLSLGSVVYFTGYFVYLSPADGLEDSVKLLSQYTMRRSPK